MKYVSLKFPDIIQLAKFHMDLAITNVKLDFRTYTLTGHMTDEEIVTACKKYLAMLDQPTPNENE